MQKTLLAVIAAAVVSVAVSVNFAVGAGEPADKAQAAASDIDRVNEAEGEDGDLILSETMRVDSVSDLIIQTSAECSILTALYTAGGPDQTNESDGSFGQVKLWVEIDGTRVPVSTNDGATNEQGDEDDLGEVVFCNRAYQRTVTDNEQDENNDGGDTDLKDGIDTEDDFIRTRAANAFNWMAFNVGKEYDSDGDNVVTINLLAEYDRGTLTQEGEDDPVTGDDQCDRRHDDDLSPYSATCADAFVGSRSMLVEVTHASNSEQPAQVNDDPGGDDPLPLP